MWEQDDGYEALRAGSIDGTDAAPHDHAIVRAMKAHYNPRCDEKIQGDPHLTLFVGRLCPHTTEDTLAAVFGRCGTVARLRIVRDIVTGESRRYAFVTFVDAKSTQEAFLTAHHLLIDNYEVIVDYERERTMEGWVPRRLGGGLGGKKESGQLRFGGRERPFRKPFAIPGQVVAEEHKAIYRLRMPPPPRRGPGYGYHPYAPAMRRGGRGRRPEPRAPCQDHV
eukprot:TRINITY_DN8036_c0_g1_i1.p2 TRINITY_DN8036_c0_g1~~TRINITY_DN8036_c0_g1_i1.p2  ORF type:complete len:223 (-),score=21.89 TRINITY_DN8036_c0_g1_i1:37-705(-)